MDQALISDYTVRELSAEDFFPLFNTHLPIVFAENDHLSPGYAYSDEEKQALEPLRKRLTNAFMLRFGIFHEETFVGWHLELQIAPSNFDMTSTGIHKEHRRKGIYTALLQIVLERVKAEGFQVVSSQDSRYHLVTNALSV